MNGGLVVERRLQLGLSRSDLARLTGLSWDVIVAIEERGEPPALTLNAARRLAAALAVDLTTVAAAWGRPPAQQDDIRLEALLAHADQPLSLTRIARALRWSLEHAQHVLQRLDGRLAATGQTLRHVAPGRYELAARGDVLQAGDLSRLREHEQAITAPEAALLRRLIIGQREDRCWANFNHSQRRTTARLAERGLIRSDGTWVHVTADVDANLQPDLDRTGPHGVQRPLRDRRATAAEQ